VEGEGELERGRECLDIVEVAGEIAVGFGAGEIEAATRTEFFCSYTSLGAGTD